MQLNQSSPYSVSVDLAGYNLNLKSLDALRGFLALYVLAGHCRWLLWRGYADWAEQSHPLWQRVLAIASSFLRYGHEAVIVFFVLSGFFIHLRLAKQLSKSSVFQFDLIQFIRRRSHRLIPPYFFALVITILFDIVGTMLYPTLYHGATGDTLLDINFVRKGYSLNSVLPALMLLPSSLGKDFGSNGPFWSLAYEIVYYALYPLWLLLRRKSALLAYGAGLAVAILGISLSPNPFMSGVLSHYPIWLCGAAIAELISRRSKLCFLQSASMWLLTGAFFCIAFVGINISILANVKLFLYAVLGSTVVLAGLNIPVEFCRFSSHKLLEWLGLQSYSIYILHFPMVTLLSAWVIEKQGSRPSDGWLAVTGFIGSLLLCNLCFRICERNFLHARIKLKPQS